MIETLRGPISPTTFAKNNVGLGPILQCPDCAVSFVPAWASVCGGMRWIRVRTLYVKVGDLNVRVQREWTASPHAWGDLCHASGLP